MNERLKLAVEEVELLSEDAQDEIALKIRKMAAMKRIEAKLAASEARGGETPHEEFMAELMERYGSSRLAG